MADLWFTRRTMPFDENLRNAANLRSTTTGTLRELHVVQTGHAATVDAHEMRMFIPTAMLGIESFKPPDVIPQFGPAHEFALSKIVQVPENGRLIKAEGDQFLSHIRMCHGSISGTQFLQDSNPGRGGTHSGSTQQIPDAVHFLRINSTGLIRHNTLLHSMNAPSAILTPW